MVVIDDKIDGSGRDEIEEEKDSKRREMACYQVASWMGVRLHHVF